MMSSLSGLGSAILLDFMIRFGATGRGRVTLAAAQALPGLGDRGLRRRMRLHCGWRAARKGKKKEITGSAASTFKSGPGYAGGAQGQ